MSFAAPFPWASRSFLAILLLYLVTAVPRTLASAIKPRNVRSTSLFISPNALPDLPPAAAGAASPLNIDNIQGDIIVGMKKKKELFYFFVIDDADTFKSKLQSDIHTLITSASDLLSVSTQPITAVNLAFSKVGLNTLGITDDLGDVLFNVGQEATVGVLGDNIDKWVPQFRNQAVHGVFLLASDTDDNINNELANIEGILECSISELYRLDSAARPGAEQGHEHFGFMDGIGQPALDGFNTPLPGQAIIPPGVIIVGADGDRFLSNRPAWALDGSFLAFRQLQQFVPEFNKFVADNAPNVTDLTPEESVDLFGARMVGRWKSGAPVDLSPLRDDTVLAADPTRNNDFDFNHTTPGFNFTSDQTFCPFSAHIRKTFPRADIPDPSHIVVNHIIRGGIPYGPEVTESEQSSQTTTTERGLAFVAYQADINSGFFFLQNSWANNPNFIVFKSDPSPGFDPLIGTVAGNRTGPRFASGLDLNDPDHDYSMPDFVLSRGGEYFFSPPISAIVSGFSSAN